MHAITDVELVEVSTPEIEDVVRHEDDYGRASSGGPLTRPTGIEIVQVAFGIQSMWNPVRRLSTHF